MNETKIDEYYEQHLCDMDGIICLDHEDIASKLAYRDWQISKLKRALEVCIEALQSEAEQTAMHKSAATLALVTLDRVINEQ